MDAKEQIRLLEKKLQDTEYMMDSLIQNMAVGIIRIYYDNASAKVVYVSDTACRLLGYTMEEYEHLRENSESEFYFLKDYEKKMIKEAKEAMKGKMLPREEYQLKAKDGNTMWVAIRGEVVSASEEGLLVQYAMMDMTGYHETVEQMRLEQKKLNIVVEIAADLIFEYDIKNDSMHYTRQSEDGLNAEHVPNNYFETMRTEGWIHPDDMDELEDFCEQMRTGKPAVHTILRKRFADRKFHWIEADGRTIFDENGAADKVIGKITNIDERMEKEELLKIGSERDSLTGLYNHKTCIEKTRKQLKLMKPGEKAVLIVCDIDNFKQINDNNGHLFGDAVLCTFADELRSVFPSALKGRIGGDEFMVLIRNTTQEEVELKLQQLQDQFSKLNVEDGGVVKISCSIGAVVCNYEKHDYKTAFQLADAALYKVKNANKGMFYIVNINDNKADLRKSYLKSKKEEKEYVREESIIRNDEDLVLFSLELLENVEDVRIGLKMVADRICRFFGFDELLYIRQDGDVFEKVFHWGSQNKPSFRSRILEADEVKWAYTDKKYDENNSITLNHSEMVEMGCVACGSMLIVKYDKQDGTRRYVIFVDRLLERTWELERSTMIRLSSIIYNRILRMKTAERNLEETEIQINYDSLTNLPNYSKFLTMSEQYLQGVNKADKSSYFFMYVDFENFQYMNEIYGYSVGDAVLRRFAGYLKDFNKSVYFSRITSDHYCGLFRDDERNLEEIKKYLISFCDIINKEYPLGNVNLVCGFSQVMGNDDEAVSVLVDCANVARKHGKGKGETCFFLYSDKIKIQNETEMNVVTHMTTALENREFQAYLQPKVSLHTGKIVGAEALVRWQRGEGILFYPDQFIPVFERNGFITKVDFYVLEEVLKYLKSAIDAGEEVVPVSVNFSRLHNNDEGFVDKIKTLLDKYNVSPHLLEVEVTESVYMYDFKGLRDKAKRLQDMGVVISIDDFGSGYSSLNVLSKVSADIIKLDRQFLMDEDGESSTEFIKYLINMIKHLGYKTIAEGVETKEQEEMLKGANCDMVQGYYYARPMPIVNFRQFLVEFNERK